MLSRISFLLSGCIFILLLASCSDDQKKPQGSSGQAITSVDELHQFVLGINFTIMSPNGKTVDFVPDQILQFRSNVNYTSPGNGFHFTGVNNFLFRRGSATLTFRESTYSFSNVVCTSGYDVSVAFPEANISSSLFKLLLYIAVDSNIYTDEEIIFGKPFLEANYLQATVDPLADPDFYGSVQGLFATKSDFYSLAGKHETFGDFFKSNGLLTGSGAFPSEYVLEFYCSE